MTVFLLFSLLFVDWEEEEQSNTEEEAEESSKVYCQIEGGGQVYGCSFSSWLCRYKEPSELDPERWLPLKERTYMRKRRRTPQQQATGIGSQGTGSINEKEINLYDAKARADQAKLNPKQAPVCHFHSCAIS